MSKRDVTLIWRLYGVNIPYKRDKQLRSNYGLDFTKIVGRLRSGYAAVGVFTHADKAVLPCPRCGGHDSMRHMLLNCRVSHEQRTVLFERVAATTEGRVEITLPSLIGFHKSLPSRELRQITTATGQFVLDIGRHV